MKLFDQHIHTKYSPDSTAEIGDYLEIAAIKGREYFVCTDHVDFGCVCFSNDTIPDFKAREREFQSFRKKYPNIQILNGVEIGFRADYEREILNIIEDNNFDIVLLSVHDNGVIDFYWPEGLKKYGLLKAMNDSLDITLKAVETISNYNVLAHIDFTFKSLYLIDNSYTFKMFEEKLIKILKRVISSGKSLEINTRVQSFLPESHTHYLLDLYKSLGGTKLTVSSDAHSKERYEADFDKYISIIKQHGFTQLRVYVRGKEHIAEI